MLFGRATSQRPGSRGTGANGEVADRMSLALLIPAFQPTERLVELIDAVRRAGAFTSVVVVDDGSGPAFRQTFAGTAARERVTVVRHAVNLGKGAALKTGLNHLLLESPDLIGIVTADADGQHSAEDIGRVADRLTARPDALVLGARRFEGRTPWRSRFGNAMTRVVYAALVGPKLMDTQTGLRGLPLSLVPELLRLKANRYEFEMDMLIAARNWGHPFEQVPISTIYYGDNDTSHFHPVADSVRIYASLLKSSLTSQRT